MSLCHSVTLSFCLSIHVLLSLSLFLYFIVHLSCILLYVYIHSVTQYKLCLWDEMKLRFTFRNSFHLFILQYLFVCIYFSFIHSFILFSCLLFTLAYAQLFMFVFCFYSVYIRKHKCMLCLYTYTHCIAIFHFEVLPTYPPLQTLLRYTYLYVLYHYLYYCIRIHIYVCSIQRS